MKKLIIVLSALLYGFIPVENLKNTFGYIKGYYQIKTKSIDNCIACYSTQDDLERINKINEQLSNTPYVSASAFIFFQKEKETFLMTSAHVCDELNTFMNDLKFKRFSIELQNIILKRQGLFDKSDLFNFYFIDTEIVVFSYKGTKYKLKEIKVSNKEKDICIINTEKKWGKPVVFSKVDCNYEEVFNMSTSGGYYYPNAVPIRKGIMNTVIPEQTFNNRKFKNVNLYTLDIKPGASGSAVFNSNGNVCGNVNVSYTNLDLSSGASRQDLIDFFEKHKNSL